jgi:hypothetical protein
LWLFLLSRLFSCRTGIFNTRLQKNHLTGASEQCHKIIAFLPGYNRFYSSEPLVYCNQEFYGCKCASFNVSSSTAGNFFVRQAHLFGCFFAPLSVELSDLCQEQVLICSFPPNLYLFGILILFLLKIIHERNFDRKILLHPVSLAIYLNLFWILITSITSTMPMVSFKFLLARLWFLTAFYFLMAKIFTDGQKIEKYVWLYLAGFLIVIFYSIYRHWGYGLLDKQAAHYVVTPFYNDHTSYGAALAMYLPFAAWFALSKSYSVKIRPGRQ